MLKYVVILLANVMIGSISQVMLKKSAISLHKNTLTEYLNGWVISAYFLYVITTILGILVYRKLPLSMGQAIEASSYIYIMIFDAILFHERINAKKVGAILLIVVGIIMCSLKMQALQL